MKVYLRGTYGPAVPPDLWSLGYATGYYHASPIGYMLSDRYAKDERMLYTGYKVSPGMSANAYINATYSYKRLYDARADLTGSERTPRIRGTRLVYRLQDCDKAQRFRSEMGRCSATKPLPLPSVRRV